MRRTIRAAAFPLLVFAVICCDKVVATPPTSPTPQSPQPVPAPPSPAGSGTPIAIGQTTQFTLHASDRYCPETDPDGTVLLPCQRYLVTVPGGGGLVTVHVEWTNPENLLDVEGRVSPAGPIASGGCCSSPIDARFTVSAGSQFLIFVQWDGNRSNASLPPDATQDFTLTASFVSTAAGQEVPQ